MKNYITTHNSFDLLEPLFDEFFLSSQPQYEMRTDILEFSDHYEMKINLPEVKKENVSLKVEDDYLTVSVKDKAEKENKEGHYIVRERKVNNLTRSYYLGDGVDKENVSARLNEGVLTVTIQKLVKTNKDKYITIE